MPATTNLKNVDPGINPLCQSVTGWFYAAAWDPPVAPNPMPTVPAEVTISTAHYVVYEGFTGKNGTGTSLVEIGQRRASIDCGDSTALQAFQATTIEDLLLAAFPAPGPP